MTLRQAIRKLTCSNRRSADQIARYLEKQGIKGKRNSSVQCPVARWLRQELGGTVLTRAYSVMYYGPFPRVVKYGYGDSLKEFVKRFDNGGFPNLLDDTV